MSDRTPFYEGWVAELDEIVRRYRRGDTPREGRLGLDEALRRLRKLGLSTGQGLRLLRGPDPA